MRYKYANLESDEHRLPHGMERVGYDADTQTYTYRDRAEGRYYEGESGARYGVLHPRSARPSTTSTHHHRSKQTLSNSNSWQPPQLQTVWLPGPPPTTSNSRMSPRRHTVNFSSPGPSPSPPPRYTVLDEIRVLKQRIIRERKYTEDLRKQTARLNMVADLRRHMARQTMDDHVKADVSRKGLRSSSDMREVVKLTLSQICLLSQEELDDGDIW